MQGYGERLIRQAQGLVALCLFSAGLAAADPVYRIGVLANRGTEAAIAEWSAHVDYLNRRLAPLRFELAPLSFHDLSVAAQQRRVQFVITNPGHYAEMAFTGSINRIATRQMLGPAGILDRFGGVVIGRASRTDLNTYADLRGKRLLIPDSSSLGGWQVHVGAALAEGIELRTDTASIKEVGTHDEVVFGILAGRADAGLVRTGLLESMAAEGRILLDDFRVINLRHEPDFPYRLSTRLYPEWPIARVEGTPEEVTRQVLIALLNMAQDDPAARAAGLDGWTVPLNYQPVNDLLYRTRQGPYEHLPITGRDVVERYGLHLAVAIGLIMLLIGLALANSITINRTLRRTRDGLAEREEQFRSLVTNIPGVVYRCAPDQDWTVHYISEHIRDLSGYPASDFIERRRSYASIIHPDDVARVDQEVNDQVAAGHPFVLEYRIVGADGQTRWILEHGRAHYGPDGTAQWLDGIFLDISPIKQAEAKLRQASAVFQHTAEGIIVTDAQRRILTVNPAFVGIAGYNEAELIGHTPAILRSGRHDAAFFAAMWR
ncbi:MAG: PhnD/SsuA/transferrin family substrate-binding protein, partial [Hydrogenophilaceae bacterium]